MIPFRNREACHRCHEPSHRINGIMLFDLDAGGIRDEVNSDLRWLVGGTASFALAPHRPDRDRGAGVGAAAAAALRDDGPAHRGGRPRAADPRGGRRHRFLAGPGVQHHGRLGDRPRRRGAQRARAPRDGHQQHRRRDRRARPAAKGRGRERRLPAPHGHRARRGGRLLVPRRDDVALRTSATARLSPAWGPAARRSASASGASPTGPWPGRRCTPPRSGARTGRSSRSWRCGATSPSGARPRPASPRPTASPRSGSSPPAFRTR